MGCASSSAAIEPKSTEQPKAPTVQSSTVEAFDTTDNSDFEALEIPTSSQNTVIDWEWKPADTKTADSDSAGKAQPLKSRNTPAQNSSGFEPMPSMIELLDFEETEFDDPAVANAPVVEGRNRSPRNP